jgi:hypothetical protein
MSESKGEISFPSGVFLYPTSIFTQELTASSIVVFGLVMRIVRVCDRFSYGELVLDSSN